MNASDPPHYDAHGVTVYHGDCRDVLRALPDASVDAITTDPPYELGFMGRAWDGSGIAYDVAMWAECLRVLKPGGHLLAFGGTRTWHRLACAIEDAGFEIRDSIMSAGAAWVYGSGFPKSKNLDGDWEGWGTALKPAWEPIVIARRPLDGTVAANVAQHGTGALNIAATRIEYLSDRDYRRNAGFDRTKPAGGTFHPGGGAAPAGDPAGRWPSNVILSHGADCEHEDDGGCVEGCPIAELDAQSGTLTSGANPTRRGTDKFRDAYGDFKGQEDCTPARGADAGGASRFFPTFRYEAKADATERPRAGDTAHPTVKPLALMRWLVRLVTPPGGLVLDPFAGSGTTAEACIVEGFRCTTIEREAEYLPLIVHRITRRTNPVANLTAQAERGQDVDLGLFSLLEDGAA